MTGTAGFTLSAGIFKNGTIYQQSNQLINYSSSFSQSLHVSDIIYFNGTTDYIDGRFQTNFGTATSMTSEGSKISGQFLRP